MFTCAHLEQRPKRTIKIYQFHLGLLDMYVDLEPREFRFRVSHQAVLVNASASIALCRCPTSVDPP